jgi:hypothetical protein
MGEVIEEAASDRGFRGSPEHALRRMCQRELFLSSGHPDVEKTPFLLELPAVEFGSFVWKEAFLTSDDRDGAKFQPFTEVQCHEG